MNSRRIVTKVLYAFVQTEIFKNFNASLMMLETNYKFDFELPKEIDNVPVEIVTLQSLSKGEKSLKNEFSRYFELNSPIIDRDEIIFKIDHHLSINLIPPFQSDFLPDHLTRKENEVVTRLLDEDRNNPKIKDIKSHSMAINCHWSYFHLKFNDTAREFEIKKIDLKSIG